jgi:predicted RNA-binding Zn-ribbon protein involved in translation (DUF1610 family)
MKRTELYCPRCSKADLVRTKIKGHYGVVVYRGARCLVCGSRFRVSRDEYSRLPIGYPGLPFEKPADLGFYMLNVHMTAPQKMFTAVSVVVGFVVAFWFVVRWSEPLFGLVIIPIILLSWWLGYWIHRPPRVIPNHCTRCGYYLHGISSNRCPECGLLVDESKT